MTNIIDYRKIMQIASLSAIQNILRDASENGLPGEHHFYITFDMLANGVNTSVTLREKYPEEMTIVIQNWYDGFVVTDTYFSITLNFGNVRETLQIPFSAIRSFVDPSVEFGITFESSHNKDARTNPQNGIAFSDKTVTENLETKKSGDVVNLESFRKS